MKKIVIIYTVLLAIVSGVSAQKFAYVDSEYILENMPEYTNAKFQLDQVAKRWQQEIQDKNQALDKDIKTYEAEKVLLTEDMRIKREKELDEKRQAILDLQKKRFGKGGDLFKKQQELIKPIQDKVFDAIKELAENKNYGMIFDKAGSTTVMFGNAKFDLSDNIIRSLGYEPGKNTAEPDDNSGPDGQGGVIQDVKDKAKDMYGGNKTR